MMSASETVTRARTPHTELVVVGYVGRCPTCGGVHARTRWAYLSGGIVIEGHVYYWYAVCVSGGDLIFTKMVDDEPDDEDNE